ncbi:MAG: hypothetical protein ACOY90_00050 [Candidatus Zhuqueibacterota bacterium]
MIMNRLDGIHKRFFNIGIALILASYPVWAISLILGGFAISHSSRNLYIAAGIFYVSNWLLFGIGLFLAGMEGYRYSKKLIRKYTRFFSIRKLRRRRAAAEGQRRMPDKR